ncbi:MAG: hypothetical protein ACO3QC_10020 [Phycisphaerales bacterium]
MIRCFILAVLFAALVAATVHAQRPTVEQLDAWRIEHRELLDAIRQVESGGDDRAVGDDGKAIGAYQIWSVYHQDATEWCKALAGPWADCYGRVHAERIVVAYWHRYCRQALRDGDLEVLARVHNGGPRGHKKQATLGYWTKVQKALEVSGS